MAIFEPSSLPSRDLCKTLRHSGESRNLHQYCTQETGDPGFRRGDGTYAKVPRRQGSRFFPAAVFVAILSIFSLAVPALGQTAVPPAPYADRQLDDPKLEAQASTLMETIRCLVCQSQSIADSNASMAGDMRSQIRQRILAGEKPEHIRKWLVERYGAWVTYAPPVEPLTWPLWAAPIILLAIGVWLLRGRLKRRKHKDGGS